MEVRRPDIRKLSGIPTLSDGSIGREAGGSLINQGLSSTVGIPDSSVTKSHKRVNFGFEDEGAQKAIAKHINVVLERHGNSN